MQTVWIAVFMIYAAPPDAVNWPGPWTPGMIITERKSFFQSEAECRNYATSKIEAIQQMMRAPQRFQCIQFPSGLPKGAPRR